MAQHDQLEWEARSGRPVAAAAFASALLSIAAVVLQAAAFSDRPSGDRGALLAIDRNAGQLLGASAAQALALLLLIAVLWFLYRATKHRRPELPLFAISLAIGGPLLLALAGVLTQLDIVGIASDFTESGATRGRAGETRAEDLLEDRSPIFLALGFAGQLALGFALLLLSLNAMRVGLLSRFVGVVGIIVGVLTVIPILQGPLIVRVLWLGALGLLFVNKWPGGRGPAWETGEAAPWPSAAERAGRAGGSQASGAQPPLENDQAVGGTQDAAGAPAASARKRRRKRRR